MIKRVIVTFLLSSIYVFCNSCSSKGIIGITHKTEMFVSYYTGKNMYEKKQEHVDRVNQFIRNKSICSIQFQPAYSKYITFVVYHI